MEEPGARVSEQEQKRTKVSARGERQSKQTAKREVKAAPSTGKRFRDRQVVSFVREAYRELRYKVTWPTFPEARNMTLIVIALSTVVGIILGLVDAGLFQLFRLITGK